MQPLLAWSQDDFLANRSGYHVLADFLDARRIVTKRADPSGGVALLGTRLLRRASLSRWYTGGSALMEQRVWAQCRAGFSGPVHLLWCDRDVGFLDLVLNRSINPLIGTFHHPADQLDQIIHFKSRLHRLSAMILMSETQRPWFLDQGVPEEKIQVILHGVDTQFFHPPERPHGPCSETRLLAVGSTGRDFPLLAKTASHFQGRKDIHFEILGPLEKRSLFDSLKNVTYRTGVPDAALLTSYQDATCLLHLATAATANNVLLEALACGLPVIASRVGGVPEYLTPGCGWLVEPACMDSCIGAIEACLSDPASLGEMRKKARTRAESLSWSRIADQTTVLYQSLF